MQKIDFRYKINKCCVRTSMCKITCSRWLGIYNERVFGANLEFIMTFDFNKGWVVCGEDVKRKRGVLRCKWFNLPPRRIWDEMWSNIRFSLQLVIFVFFFYRLQTSKLGSTSFFRTFFCLEHLRWVSIFWDANLRWLFKKIQHFWDINLRWISNFEFPIWDQLLTSSPPLISSVYNLRCVVWGVGRDNRELYFLERSFTILSCSGTFKIKNSRQKFCNHRANGL